MTTLIKNGRIVTPTKILTNHSMVIRNGFIDEIFPDGEKTIHECSCVDANNAFLLPGMIDIHSDMIEALIQPRSTALMDFSLGLEEAEKQLAACGITTIFHSISMFREGSWDTKKIRTAPLVQKLAKLIREKQTQSYLIHNQYHLRYEIDNLECFDTVCQMMKDGFVQLLSIMDHSPGQGQYQDLSIYRKHLPGEGKNLTDEEFANLIAAERKKPKVSTEQLSELTLLAQELGIPIASHDDDTTEKIQHNSKYGIRISEFPITLEVAKAAHNAGMFTLLGTPNILRGGSHSGNLSAETAIREGCGDILCSDYYPQAILRSVFYLANKKVLSLPDACRLATLNPAKAVGLEKVTGSLEPGKQADFLIVEKRENGTPLLRQTWVSGRPALSTTYYKGEEVYYGNHIGN